MKDKVLRTAVTSAVESITQALHSYSDKPIFCQILIGTRDEDMKENPDEYDVYHVKAQYSYVHDRGDLPIMTADAKVTYSIDHGNELIRRVEPIGKKGGEEDGP